jgi:hypothetical protein
VKGCFDVGKLFGLVYGDLFAIAAEPLETDLSVDKGKKCVVASDTDVRAGMDLRSALADENVAGEYELAVGALRTESFGLGITAVAGGTDALFVGKELQAYVKHFDAPP